MIEGGIFNDANLSQDDIECSTVCIGCGKLIRFKIILEKPITYRERIFKMIEDHGSWFCDKCSQLFE